MMKKWVDILRLFDLGEYESRTYAALVMNGPSTVSEIRKSAGIPYSREYDVLEGLTKRGFVKVQPGRPLIYSAVDPRKILKKECEIRVNVVENLLDEIGPVYDKALKKEAAGGFFWTLKGKRNVEDKLVEMINGSKKEVLIVGASPIQSEKVKKSIEASVKRKVEVKCWGEFDSESKSLLKDLGAEARFFSHNHSRYVLSDGREALILPEDNADSDRALYTTNQGCVNLYKSYFNHIWDEAS